MSPLAPCRTPQDSLVDGFTCVCEEHIGGPVVSVKSVPEPSSTPPHYASNASESGWGGGAGQQALEGGRLDRDVQISLQKMIM